MKKLIFLLSFSVAFFACAATTDRHFDLDPPNHNLRGHTANDDLSESYCDPVKRPDGSLEYQCVVHFLPDYQMLLDKIDQLVNDLKACQASKL